MSKSSAMTPAKLTVLGHARMSPLKAIRLHCLDCCVGSAHEVSLCAAYKCPSWPFRLGHNPWVAENLKRSHQPPRPKQPGAEPPAPAIEIYQGEAIKALVRQCQS